MQVSRAGLPPTPLPTAYANHIAGILFDFINKWNYFGQNLFDYLQFIIAAHPAPVHHLRRAVPASSLASARLCCQDMIFISDAAADAFWISDFVFRHFDLCLPCVICATEVPNCPINDALCVWLGTPARSAAPLLCGAICRHSAATKGCKLKPKAHLLCSFYLAVLYYA